MSTTLQRGDIAQYTYQDHSFKCTVHTGRVQDGLLLVKRDDDGKLVWAKPERLAVIVEGERL